MLEIVNCANCRWPSADYGEKRYCTAMRSWVHRDAEYAKWCPAAYEDIVEACAIAVNQVAHPLNVMRFHSHYTADNTPQLQEAAAQLLRTAQRLSDAANIVLRQCERTEEKGEEAC